MFDDHLKIHNCYRFGGPFPFCVSCLSVSLSLSLQLKKDKNKKCNFLVENLIFDISKKKKKLLTLCVFLILNTPKKHYKNREVKNISDQFLTQLLDHF